VEEAFSSKGTQMTYLLAVGKYPNTVSGLMQWALSTIEIWCSEVGLSVNPDKTGLVAFTRKRKLQRFFEPQLSGVKLSLSGSVKYLGVILASQLTWKEHVQAKVRKAHNLLWACRRACRVGWGLRPKVVHWLYVTIVWPTISFASLVWWPGCQMASTKSKLSKVQRLACLGITGALRTTPIGAMEVLVGLPPLDLAIQGEARSAAHRLWSLGGWSYLHPQRGHSCILTRLQKSDPIYNMRVDFMRPVYNLEPNYRVTMLAREEWTRSPWTPPAVRGLIWYMDGSRTAEGTGAGVYGQSVNRRLSIPLGKHATVFQAEVYAILACGHEIEAQDRPEKYISICSDSQTALKALKAAKTTSPLVRQCQQALNDISARHAVRLYWVPGHAGVRGNETGSQGAVLVSSLLGQSPF
jgi:ribonuclease HI